MVLGQLVWAADPTGDIHNIRRQSFNGCCDIGRLEAPCQDPPQLVAPPGHSNLGPVNGHPTATARGKHRAPQGRARKTTTSQHNCARCLGVRQCQGAISLPDGPLSSAPSRGAAARECLSQAWDPRSGSAACAQATHLPPLRPSKSSQSGRAPGRGQGRHDAPRGIHMGHEDGAQRAREGGEGRARGVPMQLHSTPTAPTAGQHANRTHSWTAG